MRLSRTTFSVILALALIATGLIAWKRPDRALQVATANVAQTLCAGVFVSGLAPDADGFDPDTPQLGYSMSKSVVNALLGVLVRQAGST